MDISANIRQTGKIAHTRIKQRSLTLLSSSPVFSDRIREITRIDTNSTSHFFCEIFTVNDGDSLRFEIVPLTIAIILQILSEQPDL